MLFPPIGPPADRLATFEAEPRLLRRFRGALPFYSSLRSLKLHNISLDRLPLRAKLFRQYNTALYDTVYRIAILKSDLRH